MVNAPEPEVVPGSTPEKNILERGLDSFNTTFQGKAQDVTNSIAKGLEPSGIDPATTRRAVPLFGAGATALLGYLLIDPLTKGGQLLGKGVRGVVTGFGYFEKIPLIGGLFTGLGKGVDKVSEWIGAAATVAASIITFKALQADAPAGPNLDDTNAIRRAGDIPPLVVPVTPKPDLTASQAQREQNAREAREKLRRELQRTPADNEGRATESQLRELEKQLGGRPEFEAFHRDAFGKSPGVDGVDPRLTEARARAMIDYVRAEGELARTNSLVENTSGWTRWGASKIPVVKWFVEAPLSRRQRNTVAGMAADNARGSAGDTAADIVNETINPTFRIDPVVLEGLAKAGITGPDAAALGRDIQNALDFSLKEGAGSVDGSKPSVGQTDAARTVSASSDGIARVAKAYQEGGAAARTDLGRLSQIMADVSADIKIDTAMREANIPAAEQARVSADLKKTLDWMRKGTGSIDGAQPTPEQRTAGETITPRQLAEVARSYQQARAVVDAPAAPAAPAGTQVVAEPATTGQPAASGAPKLDDGFLARRIVEESKLPTEAPVVNIPRPAGGFFAPEFKLERAGNLLNTALAPVMMWSGWQGVKKVFIDKKFEPLQEGAYRNFDAQNNTIEQITGSSNPNTFFSWMPQAYQANVVDAQTGEIKAATSGFVIDPRGGLHGTASSLEIAGGGSILGGEGMNIAGKALGREGMQVTGQVMKNAGGRIFIAAYVVSEGLDVAQLAIDGHGEEAAKKGVKSTGKLLVMTLVPAGGGVAIVVVADSLEEMNKICDEVVANYPDMKRKFYVTDQNGKPVPVTEDNAVKMMPGFYPELLTAAGVMAHRDLGNTASEDQFKTHRDELIAEMKVNPFFAWKEIYRHTTGKAFASDQEASDALKEYASHDRADYKTNAASALLQAIFTGDVATFESGQRDAGLSAVAREIKAYMGVVSATPDNPLGTISAVAQAPRSTASPILMGMPLAPASAAPAEDAKAFNVVAADNQQLLSDSYRNFRDAQINKLILRSYSQHYEDTVLFLRSSRMLLAPGSEAQKDMQTRRDVLVGNIAKTHNLTTEQAQSLVPMPPELRTTVLPGLNGEASDGSDTTKVVDAFCEAYQEFYGVHQIRVNGTDGTLVGMAYKDMNASQKLDYFSKAFAEYKGKLEEYNGKRHHTQTVSMGEGAAYSYDYYDTTVDNNSINEREFLFWLFCSKPVEGNVDTSKGQVSRKAEVKFLEDEMRAKMQAVVPDINFGSDAIQPNGDLNDTITDRNRTALMKHLEAARDNFSKNFGAFAEQLRNEEQAGGKIFSYVQQAQFLDASMEMARVEGVLLLGSDRIPGTESNVPGTLKSPHEGSWISFKNLKDGSYYYAEGKWEKSTDHKSGEPALDVFIVQRIVSQETGERITLQEPTALNISNLGNQGASSLAGQKFGVQTASGRYPMDRSLLAEEILNFKQRAPQEIYTDVRTNMQPGAVFGMQRSVMGLRLPEFDKVQGDRSVKLGGHASIVQIHDYETGIDYSLAGTWKMRPDGRRVLEPSMAYVPIPGGQTIEIPVAEPLMGPPANANTDTMGPLRERIMQAYMEHLTPAQRAAHLEKLDMVNYQEVASGKMVMPDLARRQSAVARADDMKRISARTMLQEQLVRWTDENKLAIAYMPVDTTGKRTSIARDAYLLQQGENASPVSRSTVVLNLTPDEKVLFRKLATAAGLSFPNLDTQTGPAVFDDHNRPLFSLNGAGASERIMIPMSDMQYLLPQQVALDYFQHLMPEGKDKLAFTARNNTRIRLPSNLALNGQLQLRQDNSDTVLPAFVWSRKPGDKRLPGVAQGNDGLSVPLMFNAKGELVFAAQGNTARFLSTEQGLSDEQARREQESMQQLFAPLQNRNPFDAFTQFRNSVTPSPALFDRVKTTPSNPRPLLFRGEPVIFTDGQDKNLRPVSFNELFSNLPDDGQPLTSPLTPLLVKKDGKTHP